MQKYEYKYVQAQLRIDMIIVIKGTFTQEIDLHAREGWRFVSWLPEKFAVDGSIKTVVLVFEREIEND